VWLALATDHLRWPWASALYWGYLTGASMAIGLYWWARRPLSRFGPLLVGFGIAAWVVSWSSSDWPRTFSLAGMAEPVLFGLSLVLLLVFSMGRFEPPWTRWLLAAFGLACLISYPVLVEFGPAITGGGALALCAPNCPHNPFQIGTHPSLVRVTSETAVWLVLAVSLAVVLVFAARIARGTRPQRRALLAWR
jgi:hypothetical protein